MGRLEEGRFLDMSDFVIVDNDSVPIPDLAPIVDKVQREPITSSRFLAKEGGRVTAEEREENWIRAYLKAMLSRDEQGTGIGRLARTVDAPRHTEVDVMWVGITDEAKRATNQLKMTSLRPDLLDFGSLWYAARENPALADHGYAHERRAERTLEAVLLNIPELRTMPRAEEWIHSAFLATSIHDIDQIISLERNIARKKEGKSELAVKQGHSLGGAVYAMLMEDAYTVEGFIDKPKARKISRGAAYMIMGHDNPEKYNKGLMGNIAPEVFLEEKSPEEGIASLYTAYTKGEVNKGKLTPAHILKLLQYEKGKIHVDQLNAARVKKGKAPLEVSPFIEDGSIYGLPPEVEKVFAQKLADLANDNASIAPHQEDEKMKALQVLSQAYVYADEAEFSSPPHESIIRKLETQYSKERGLLPVEWAKFVEFVNVEAKPPQPFTTESSPYEVYMWSFLHGPGTPSKIYDGAASDFHRLMWEYVQLEKPKIDNQKHPGYQHLNILSQSNFMREANKDAAIMGALAVEDLFFPLMEGDTSRVEAVLERMVTGLSGKAKRKEALRGGVSEGHQVESRQAGHIQMVNHQLEVLFDNFAQKPRKPWVPKVSVRMRRTLGGDVAQYKQVQRYFPKEIQQTREIVQTVLHYLMEKYDVSEKELASYKLLVQEGVYSGRTPYRAYLSGSEPTEARTLVEISPAIYTTLATLKQKKTAIIH